MPSSRRRYGATTPRLDPVEPKAPSLATPPSAMVRREISAGNAGNVRNAGNTKGVLLSGIRPVSWTEYIDFTATGNEAFLKHPALTLEADGDATFSGTVASNLFTGASARFTLGLSVGDILGTHIGLTATNVEFFEVDAPFPLRKWFIGLNVTGDHLDVQQDNSVGDLRFLLAGSSSILISGSTTGEFSSAGGSGFTLGTAARRWGKLFTSAIDSSGALTATTGKFSGDLVPSSAGGSGLGTHQALPWGDIQIGTTIWFHTGATRRFALVSDALGVLKFFDNDASTIRASVSAIGDFTVGNGSAIATTATAGFLIIPGCAGTPTGVPSAATAGAIALVYDTTNNLLYANDSGGWVAVNSP